MTNELFERELQNTSINDVSLADYVKENYVPVSVLEQIRDDIKAEMKEHRDIGDIDDFSTGIRYGLRSAIGIIERRQMTYEAKRTSQT